MMHHFKTQSWSSLNSWSLGFDFDWLTFVVFRILQSAEISAESKRQCYFDHCYQQDDCERLLKLKRQLRIKLILIESVIKPFLWSSTYPEYVFNSSSKTINPSFAINEFTICCIIILYQKISSTLTSGSLNKTPILMLPSSFWNNTLWSDPFNFSETSSPTESN